MNTIILFLHVEELCFYSCAFQLFLLEFFFWVRRGLFFYTGGIQLFVSMFGFFGL